MKNYYEILGVLATDTEDAIKQAYRVLAKKYHPDVNPSPDAGAMFQEIHEAYKVLSNPETKAVYDLLLYQYLQHLHARSTVPSDKQYSTHISKPKPKVRYRVRPQSKISEKDKRFIRWFVASVLSFFILYFIGVIWLVNHHSISIKENLYLSENQVLILNNRNLEKIDSLLPYLYPYRVIDFSENKLTELPLTIGKLKKVEALHLQQNQLHELPITIQRMAHLRWLNGSGNPLTSLPSTLADCPALEVLWLENCQLHSLPTTFSRMKNLKYLSLKGNPLPPEVLIQLRLDLPQCVIWF